MSMGAAACSSRTVTVWESQALWSPLSVAHPLWHRQGTIMAWRDAAKEGWWSRICAA